MTALRLEKSFITMIDKGGYGGAFYARFHSPSLPCAGAWILSRVACLSLRALQPSASRACVASPLPPCPHNMVAFAPRGRAMCAEAMPGLSVNRRADGCIDHLPRSWTSRKACSQDLKLDGQDFGQLHPARISGLLYDRGWFHHPPRRLPVRFRISCWAG